MVREESCDSIWEVDVYDLAGAELLPGESTGVTLLVVMREGPGAVCCAVVLNTEEPVLA